MKILSGVMEHPDTGVQVTTGTPIALLIRNVDQRSRDYADIQDLYRPGRYPELWFRWQGRPLILADPKALTPELNRATLEKNIRILKLVGGLVERLHDGRPERLQLLALEPRDRRVLEAAHVERRRGARHRR